MLTTPLQQAELVVLSEDGDRGGSRYSYRDVAIHSNKSSTRHWFFLPSHPSCADGRWGEQSCLPLITAAIDAWLDRGQATWQSVAASPNWSREAA
ncbi:hypothetical protein [Roseomonas sp. KE2513]|uniref:hypothetical protein n=1 Tax=Roseomonas sp. KE2513 TaxID=2479202 RepID=UPI0018DF1943|nr:hypothetical protein [Roseomonas sp. KE2513]